MKKTNRNKSNIRFFKVVVSVLFFPVMLLASSCAFATSVSWVDWTSVTTGVSGSGTGTIGLTTGTVNVGLTGNVYGLSNGATYYTPASTYGNLNPSDLIQEAAAGSVTITFSEGITDPYISLVSVGQNLGGNNPQLVTYTFTSNGVDIPISLFSTGPDQWSGISYPSLYTMGINWLEGQEFSGILQLSGTFSQLSISFSPSETWHGFNIGVNNSVPEPATMILFGTGIIGLVGVVRRRRK